MCKPMLKVNAMGKDLLKSTMPQPGFICSKSTMKSTRIMCEICSKLTIKTIEQRPVPEPLFIL